MLSLNQKAKGKPDMESILEELFYGNINPNEQFFSKESDFGRAVKVLSDKESEVLAILNENEKEVLERYINAQSEINCITAKAKFLYGLYKFPIRKFVPGLGFQIALDAMKEVDFDEN